MNRRSFLVQSLVTAAAIGSTSRSFAQANASTANPAPAVAVPELKRPPALDPTLVREFVAAGHGNLPKVQHLLGEHPKIVNASWDLGAGDWETSLGAASHVGNREIALHLLGAGARFDAFCAAMLGESDVVVPLVRFSPVTANARGPHGYSLLYHAGYSGKVAMAEAIGPHLTARARDCNQALQTASFAGHRDFVAWLLKNGVDNPNTKNFQGKTPLDLAAERQHEDVVQLLRAAGGTTAR
jgi:ankyrin repeat protein